MSIKPDAWIKRMAESEGMIEPFSENQVRVDEKGEKLISYGSQALAMMSAVPMSLKFLQIFTLQQLILKSLMIIVL